MADRKGFAFPTDPEVRLTAAIALGAVAWLVLCGRIFRDVNAA